MRTDVISDYSLCLVTLYREGAGVSMREAVAPPFSPRLTVSFFPCVCRAGSPFENVPRGTPRSESFQAPGLSHTEICRTFHTGLIPAWISHVSCSLALSLDAQISTHVITLTWY